MSLHGISDFVALSALFKNKSITFSFTYSCIAFQLSTVSLRFLVSAAALFLTIPMAVTAETNSIPTKAPSTPLIFDQLSSEPYEIRINAHLLRIPTNHLKGRPLTNNFVALFARWPGMKPYEHGMGIAPYDDMEILVDGAFKGRSSGKPPDAHAWMRQWKNHLPAYMNKTLGLWEYRSKTLPDRPDYYVADVTRVKPDGKQFNESYLISCGGYLPAGRSTDTLQCQVMYYVRDDVHVTYRFAHKHISSWRSIDDGVRKLVASTFVKKNNTNGE